MLANSHLIFTVYVISVYDELHGRLLSLADLEGAEPARPPSPLGDRLT